jgi:hypothetical protein
MSVPPPQLQGRSDGRGALYSGLHGLIPHGPYVIVRHLPWSRWRGTLQRAVCGRLAGDLSCATQQRSNRYRVPRRRGLDGVSSASASASSSSLRRSARSPYDSWHARKRVVPAPATRRASRQGQSEAWFDRAAWAGARYCLITLYDRQAAVKLRNVTEPAGCATYGILRIPANGPSRYPARMFKQGEHEPGSAAPATGHYELCNVLGRRTGVVCNVVKGQALPAGPRGWFWLLEVQEEHPDSG